MHNDFLFAGLFVLLCGLGVSLPAFIKDGLSQMLYHRPSAFGYADIALFLGAIMIIMGFGIAILGGLIYLYKEIVF